METRKVEAIKPIKPSKKVKKEDFREENSKKGKKDRDGSFFTTLQEKANHKYEILERKTNNLATNQQVYEKLGNICTGTKERIKKEVEKEEER